MHNKFNLAFSTSTLRYYAFALLLTFGVGFSSLSSYAQACNPPSPTMTLVDVNVAEASWAAVPGALWYTLEYRTTPSGSWNNITSIYSTDKTFSGLAPSTNYELRMKSHCAGNVVSAWSSSVFFTTAATTYCTSPTISSIERTFTTLKVTWGPIAPPAVYYEIRFKESSSSTWQYFTASGPNTLRTGLTPGTSYDFCIRSACHAPITSSWTCVTARTCEVISASATPSSICNGGSTNLTASVPFPQAYNYTWMPGGASGASVSVSPTSTTTYTVTGMDASSGCSTTATVTVNVGQPTSNTTTETACDSYTWAVNNQTYNTSGTYTSTSTNGSGCTHTEILILTINNSSSGTTTATACDSYVWSGPLGDGNTYTSSTNTATNVTTNASGCPHTETLNLTVNYSSTGTTTATACDSYVWAAPFGDGMTYTSSNNTATNVSTNASGCPHTETLNLTVNYSSTGTTTATACDSYVWAAPLGDGMTYTSSNNTATNVS
ncbi:MAG: fibronectin type III domain-containing protein, partial [Chitinophagaceae bacterium]|nr:fibronectin type III domain-containing protein [Chitinophagaceae bacterium]